MSNRSQRWSGILLLATGAGFLFDFFVAEDLPPIAGPLGGAILGLLMASAFAWIGIAIWRGSGLAYQITVLI